MPFCPSLRPDILLALRLEHLEIVFLRLLHLLAHHPDFGVSQEEFLDMAT